jgi:orotate phosphoribosyltransferase
MLDEQQILDRLAETGALLDGHFRLRSGLHSNRFFQAALALQHTELAAELCAQLAEQVKRAGVPINTVVAPAIGGIVVGQEVGRSLGCRAIFAEKDGDDNLILRRGFSLGPDDNVLVAEDVVTKGGRVQQTIDLVKAKAASVQGVAVLVDRSGGAVDFNVPFFRLLALQLETYSPENCPLCRAGSQAEKPGS